MYALRNKQTGSYLIFPEKVLWLTSNISIAKAMLRICTDIGIKQSECFDTSSLMIIDLPDCVSEAG